MDFKIKQLSELQEVAKNILQNLKYKTVLFEGNLGAGKTTLIKALLKELGSNDNVSSPTFSLINVYDIPQGSVFHLDLYRINSTEEAMDFGIEEYLDSENYCFIEWPDKIRELINGEFHTLKIKVEGAYRIINFA